MINSKKITKKIFRFLIIMFCLYSSGFTDIYGEETTTNQQGSTDNPNTDQTTNTTKKKKEENNSGVKDECKVSGKDEALKKAEDPENSCGCFFGPKKKMYDLKGEEIAYCVILQETIFHKKAIAGKNGIDLVSNYIYLAYKYGASIIGLICVFIIIISGIQISTAGTTGAAESAKDRIWAAILSLLLLFGSGLILKTVNPGFFI